MLHLSPGENLAKSSLHEANVTMGLGSPSPGTVAVETRTLDEHVASRGRAPDLLKIDVEGAELLVVSGGSLTLSRPESPAILFEASDLQATAFGYTSSDLKAKLVEFGYEVFRYRGDDLERVLTSEPHRLEDLIALKPRHRIHLGASRKGDPGEKRPWLGEAAAPRWVGGRIESGGDP